MAEIIESGGGGKKHGKKRGHKGSPRVDMTPMVDLGFLLLTFFVLTTTFSKPQALEINMPVPAPEKERQKLPGERVITLLLADNNIVYYYYGEFKPDALPKIEKTDYSKDGIRKILLKKNRSVFDKVKELDKQLNEGKITKEQYKPKYSEALKDTKGAMVIIKANDKAKLINVVDALDEMSICSVGTYALVDIDPAEQAEIDKQYPSSNK